MVVAADDVVRSVAVAVESRPASLLLTKMASSCVVLGTARPEMVSCRVSLWLTNVASGCVVSGTAPPEMVSCVISL